MEKGYLRVEVSVAGEADPAAAALVTLIDSQGGETQAVTDASGIAPTFTLDAPDRAMSLDPDVCAQVYSTCDIRVQYAHYSPVTVYGVQIFAGETAILPVTMTPENIRSAAGGGAQPEFDQNRIVIPPLNINDNIGTGDIPPEGEVPRILDYVAIPEYVTVHLGRPTASARDVTVSFTHYIKNVCCSEIYPTWPENALRANIYCQISLVLNRIFTEWYRSRGYSFDITNSTSFDQYFVYGRNIFENVSKLVDEIFTTYIRKNNFIEPFYAEYCNGTTATCPGLKQWGTVTLANQGYSPIRILQYYYGSGVSLYQASVVQGAQSSYPGYALRRGSSGAPVATIQQQLARIRRNYPLIPNVGTADGVFGAATEAAVRRFQSIFNLTADGVVGRATWYKISYIFAAVKKLAELTSEGITTPSVVYPIPSVVLRLGASGEYVSLAQYLLSVAGEFYSTLNPIAVDGIFGSGTRAAVAAFQTLKGITADGVIGSATWNQLYRVFYSALNAVAPPSSLVYPGTALRQGSSGTSVATMQRLLSFIAGYFPTLSPITIDGIFGSGTRAAVQAYQRLFGLTADGVIGPRTWESIVDVYNTLASYT